MFRKIRIIANVITTMIIVVVFASCKHDPLMVDISGIEAPMKFIRFDKEIFGRSASELVDSMEVIRERNVDYFDVYTYNIISIGGIEDEGFNDEITRFVTDTVYREVADSVLYMFNDFSKYEKAIEKAFRYYRYYFPEKTLPIIYTQMSGFNQSLVIVDSLIGISLDKYMGSDCPYYQYLGIPNYKRRAMFPQKMVPDIFCAIATVDYPFRSEKNNVLDNMIYQGKLLYFAEAMCPQYHDSIITGFSSRQLKWCKINEANMWTYLVENKILYDSERLTLRKYIGDAPHTQTFSQESPGRAVVWLGWQIVHSYMEKNPETKLSDIFNNNDGQQFLAASGYYPNR